MYWTRYSFHPAFRGACDNTGCQGSGPSTQSTGCDIFQLLPEERISTLQALWAYTMGGAYACFEEAAKGSIVPGKLADLVLLNGNPIAVAPEDIRNLEVDMTIVDGQIVWMSNP